MKKIHRQQEEHGNKIKNLIKGSNTLILEHGGSDLRSRSLPELNPHLHHQIHQTNQNP